MALFRCQLVREGQQESSKTSTDPITHPGELVAAVEPLFEGADREIFVALTRRMVEAGKLVGIDIVDHLIVTLDGDWLSMKERGVM